MMSEIQRFTHTPFPQEMTEPGALMEKNVFLR